MKITLDTSEKFALMWRESRRDGKKSQDEMARSLQVSRKTIENWEEGRSCPTQRQGFEWFRVLGLQPLPYYYKLLYPEFHGLTHSSSDSDINDALIAVVSDLCPEDKRKLLYCLSGEHGSSPKCLLDLATAYLHLPMRNRISMANAIVLSYSIAENMGDLIGTNHIMPNIELIRHAIRRATAAILKGKENYTSIMED